MKIYFLSILCSLLFMSCKYTDENGVVVTRDGGTHLDKARWVVTTEQRLAGKDANEDAAQDSDETPVYEVSLRSYLYVVNGVVVGTGESSLREYLTRQKKGSIVFYSDYPLLMPEAESELKSIFSEQGFPVKQIFGYTSTTSASERSECSDLADEAMGKDNDETYDYMIRLYARVHLVNGVVIGETRLSLHDYLAHQKKGIIIFKSDYKFINKVVQEYNSLFTELGFQVKQFLMPISTIGGPF